MRKITLDLKELPQELNGHTAAIYKLHKKDSGVISAGGDGLVVYWQPNSIDGSAIAKIDDVIFSMSTWKTSNNVAKDKLVCGTMSGDLFWMDLNDKDSIKRWRFHKGIVYQLLKVEERLYACGADGILSMWDTTSDCMIKSVQISQKGLRSICLLPETNILVIGDQLGNLYCYEHLSLKRLSTINKAHKGSIFCLTPLQSSDNSLVLYSGGIDKQIRVWKYNNGLLLHDFWEAHSTTINDLVVDPVSNNLISVSRDRTCKHWNIRDTYKGELISKHIGKTSINTTLLLENTLYIAGDDKTIHFWQ